MSLRTLHCLSLSFKIDFKMPPNTSKAHLSTPYCECVGILGTTRGSDMVKRKKGSDTDYTDDTDTDDILITESCTLIFLQDASYMIYYFFSIYVKLSLTLNLPLIKV